MASRNNFYYKKSLAALEFDKVLNKLAQHAVIDKTAEMIHNIKPIYNIGCVRLMLEQVTMAKQLLLYNQRLPLDKLDSNLDLYIQKSVKGLPLTSSEFEAVAKLIKNSIALRAYYQNSNIETIALDNLFSRLYSDKSLYELIDQTFLSDGSIADDASSELKNIRIKITKAAASIKDMLDSYIRRPDIAKHLQEPIVTQRYDRFVIPVKADNRGDISGLLHDTSNTGSTLFIEPMFVIEANNNIRKLEAMEQQEIERILANLTEQVASAAVPLTLSFLNILSIDFIFAKAKMSYEYDYCEPVLNLQKQISVKNARHPLISKDIMVPLTIEMGNGVDTIIVTGPNTGGKTVFLKTLGLLCLMAKAGMHVPADTAKMYIFDRVFADIGDEQSIEQSLSTFSSHLKNIRNIISAADSDSLVLFDELGSGTDPVEGAALAIAIINKIRKNKSYAAVTTHYSELKTYAIEKEGVINASFEFDLQTLRPTYRLSLGIPGKSYAFEISKHLGLDSDVIDDAKSQISGEIKRLDNVIDSLLEEKNKYQQKLNELKSEQQELENQKNELAKTKEKLLRNIDSDIEASRHKARQIVEVAKREADQFLSLLKDSKSQLDKEKMRQIKSKVRSAAYKLYDIGIDDDSLKAKLIDKMPLKEVKAGQRVFVQNVNKAGTVISVSGVKAKVDCDGIVLTVPSDSLFKPDESENTKKKQVPTKTNFTKSSSARLELDIRGKTIMEAEEDIDRFLDDAVIDRLNTVTIIHGKGTGALRAGVHKYLKGHAHVKKFQLGTYGQGDSGVTVVELK